MITTRQLYEILDKADINTMDWVPLDDAYSLVDRAFITEFGHSFYKLLDAFNLLAYKPRKNDCDKFAFLAWSFARALNGREEDTGGLGMGVLLYQPDGSPTGHAINFWVIKEDNEYKVIFWEPQTRTIKELSNDEKDSVYGIIG